MSAKPGTPIILQRTHFGRALLITRANLAASVSYPARIGGREWDTKDILSQSQFLRRVLAIGGHRRADKSSKAAWEAYSGPDSAVQGADTAENRVVSSIIRGSALDLRECRR